MDITPYTTSATIRATVGVSDTELDDDALKNQLLDVALEAELQGVFPDHEDLALRIEQGTGTEEDRQTYRLLQLYSLYFCVAEVARNWLGMLQTISDGKEVVKRPLLDAKTLNALYFNAIDNRDKWKARLSEQAEGDGTVGGLSLISISTPSYDPVTNQ